MIKITNEEGVKKKRAKRKGHCSLGTRKFLSSQGERIAASAPLGLLFCRTGKERGREEIRNEESLTRGADKSLLISGGKKRT